MDFLESKNDDGIKTSDALTLSSTSRNSFVHSLSESRPSFTSASQEFGSSKQASFAALAPQPRRVNDTSELTIDKLQLSALGLHGRDTEVSTLLQSLENIQNDETLRHLILISGTSGTGKSKLADVLRHPTETKNGLFVRGKFDMKLRHQPYAGIAKACAEICGFILDLQEHKPELYATICNEIKETIGSELNLLFEVFPILAEVIEISPYRDTTSILGVTSSSIDSKNQLNFAFLRFIRVVCKHFSSLVVALDDVHWADASSLDLIEVILRDVQNTGVLILGIYRSNEVDETHTIHRLKNQEGETPFAVTDFELGNLQCDDVNRVLQDLLAINCADKTRELAEICIEKTHGNPFFLLQFVDMLSETGMLKYNLGTLSWTWDCQRVASDASLSDNVVELLKTRMRDLKLEHIETLKLAAFLGSSFDARHVHIASKGLARIPSTDEVETSLRAIEDSGFISRVTNESFKYTWTHDKVQEAAIDLLSKSEQVAFGQNIGQLLLENLQPEELETNLFVVANLLNTQIFNENYESRLELARLNLNASRKAIALSAFDSAAEFSGKGIALLTDDAWENHYHLTLQLYSIGAKAKGFLGDVEEMESYCKAVLSRTDVPVQDKFGVYNTWIDSIMHRGFLEDATELLLDILAECKCRFPKSEPIVTLSILKNVVKVKATLNSRNSASLEEMKDEQRIQLMKLLDKLATCFYMVNDSRMPLSIFRSLNWTVKYGYSAYSPVAFATTGMILTGVLGDLPGGTRYGEQALLLLEKLKSRTSAGRTMFCVYSFLYPWTKPMQSLLKPLLHSYDVGLSSGDTESATFSIYFWVLFRFILGTRLDALTTDMILYERQMKDLKRDQALFMVKNMRQTFFNLMGRNNKDDPSRMSGEAMSTDELESCMKSVFLQPLIHGYRELLLTYFGRHVECADLVLRLGYDEWAKVAIATPNHMWNALSNGVSFFSAAKQTGKRKYYKIAQFFRRKLKKWLSMGNPNIEHYSLFLDAEAFAFHEKNEDAIAKYQQTIVLAARRGYQHDAAFASERLCEFSLNYMNDEEEASYRLREAMRYWTSWGAFGKVEWLEKKYSHLSTKPKEVDILLDSVSAYGSTQF